MAYLAVGLDLKVPCCCGPLGVAASYLFDCFLQLRLRGGYAFSIVHDACRDCDRVSHSGEIQF